MTEHRNPSMPAKEMQCQVSGHPDTEPIPEVKGQRINFHMNGVTMSTNCEDEEIARLLDVVGEDWKHRKSRMITVIEAHGTGMPMRLQSAAIVAISFGDMVE